MGSKPCCIKNDKSTFANAEEDAVFNDEYSNYSGLERTFRPSAFKEQSRVYLQSFKEFAEKR